jgi:hypothetical protein
MCHAGGWHILGDPDEIDGLRFTDGTRIYSETPIPMPEASPGTVHEAHGPLDPNGLTPPHYHNPCQRDLATTALICLLGGRR